MFDVDKTAMVLVDVQGRLAQIMYEKQTLFNSLKTMIQCMQILEVPIIWMEQIPENLGATAPEISELIVNNTPLAKSSFSCCTDPGFKAAITATGRTQVLLTGIEAHICVFQTADGLLSQGFQVQVVSDCVSSRTKENKAIGIQRIVQAGGQITSLEMAVFELLKTARAEKFKQIVKLIK